MKTTNLGYSWINVRNKQKYNEAIEENYLAAQALFHALDICVQEKKLENASLLLRGRWEEK